MQSALKDAQVKTINIYANLDNGNNPNSNKKVSN